MVNAAEQATTLVLTSKIAAVVNLFKAAFPDAKADLSPWRNDPECREWLDPDSIDIGFHLPGWSPRYQCRSLLVQIRLHTDTQEQVQRAIGLEIAGFTHLGKQWQLSTVADWHIEGKVKPATDVTDKLHNFSRAVLELFNQAAPDHS